MAIETANVTIGNGVTATNANIDMLAIGATGGTITGDSAWQPRGLAAAVKTTATSANGTVYARHAFASTTGVAYEFPFKPKAWPNTWEESILRIASNTANTRGMEVALFADGSLGLRDGPYALKWQSAAGFMTLDSGCIISTYATVGTSTAQLEVIVYEEDEITVRGGSGRLTGQNTAAANFTSARIFSSKMGSSTRTNQFLFGAPRWDTAATGLMPTMAPPAAGAHVLVGQGGVRVPARIMVGRGGLLVPVTIST